jgi:transposase-like protein
MPWKETTTMSERSNFIERAKAEGANISALCREVGISRKTGYKWLKRDQEGGRPE